MAYLIIWAPISVQEGARREEGEHPLWSFHKFSGVPVGKNWILLVGPFPASGTSQRRVGGEGVSR